jgi:2-methylcitrate dehydratase PrpD
MSSAGVTTAIVDFCSSLEFDDLPERAVTLATDAITDAIGVGILGATEPSMEKLSAALLADGGHGSSFALLTGRRWSASAAALLNGTAIHALDFDDTAHPAYSHPTSHLLPVVLALGTHRPGREVITAYVLGFEIENALGRAMNMSHYAKGWHATSTLGTIAASVMGARLLELDAEGLQIAIGLAASMASGVRANFGTMAKPLHAGLAARNGVQAALLAQVGFTANPHALDHELGYLQVFAGDQAPCEEVFETLGQPLEILREHALALKPYPSCGATHPAIEAAVALSGGGVTADRIDRIVVGVNRWTPGILIHNHPGTPLEAKFSMQHCVAAALARGRVGLDTFTAEALADPVVAELRDKVRLEVDDRVRDDPEFAAVVTLRLQDGSAVERRVDLAAGKPERWLPRQALRRKFVETSGGVLGASRADAVFETLLALPDAVDLAAAIDLLTLGSTSIEGTAT